MPRLFFRGLNIKYHVTIYFIITIITGKVKAPFEIKKFLVRFVKYPFTFLEFMAIIPC